MTVAAPAAPSDLPPVGAVGAGSTGSLLLAARAGDRLAWDELVGRLSPLLWAIARRHGLSREDAADVVRTTWLRCVERLDQDPDRVAARLVTICRRESLTVLRRETGTGPGTLGDPAGRDPRVRALDAALLAQEDRILRGDA